MGGEADICLIIARFHVNGVKYYLRHPIGLRREPIALSSGFYQRR
jgi:hypothetical protein